MIKHIFWISLAMPVYAYIGYPLILLALRALWHRPVAKQSIWPFVSLLVPVYNEAAHVARKIENSLALDYPSDCLEIVIASDGSHDATAEVARQFADGTGSPARISGSSRQDGHAKCRRPPVARRMDRIFRRRSDFGAQLGAPTRR